MSTYRDLKSWQLAVELSNLIYQTTALFPQREQYGLADQMRRASVSVYSNIAEGSKRTPAEFLHYSRIAHGSVAELESQIWHSINVKFIENNLGKKLLDLTDHTSRLIYLLIKSLIPLA